jgi:hypothetical protein
LETESLFIPVLAKEGRITRQPSLNGKEMNSLRSNGASKPKGRPGKSWWPSSGGGALASLSDASHANLISTAQSIPGY